MPFFAKHWIQRLCLAAAGVLISSFGPDQVPIAWKPVLFWSGVALALFAFIWPLIEVAFRGRGRFPERHRDIVQQLAAPLATVQEQALTYGQRDLAKMASAKGQAEELIGQIAYDHETVATVRDFLQACSIAADIHNTSDGLREARRDVARISPALFRYLHDGKRIDRSKLDLPDWCRTQGEKVAASPQDATTEPLTRQSPDDWIPLHEALRYLVYETQWAGGRPLLRTSSNSIKLWRPSFVKGSLGARSSLGENAD